MRRAVRRAKLLYVLTRAGRAVLSPGWLMLGNAGDGYICSHELSDGSGDDCVVLSLSRETLDDAIGVTPHQYLMRVRLLRAMALCATPPGR